MPCAPASPTRFIDAVDGSLRCSASELDGIAFVAEPALVGLKTLDATDALQAIRRTERAIRIIDTFDAPPVRADGASSGIAVRVGLALHAFGPRLITDRNDRRKAIIVRRARNGAAEQFRIARRFYLHAVP